MLTDEQIKAIDVKTLGSLHFARAIEAEALKAHQQAIEAAVLREREECASACEDHGHAYRLTKASGWRDVDHETAQCAYAIRSRAQPVRIDDVHKEDA